jgi:dTDP-4-dehydrorhamnose 3,5-epimerase
LIFKELDLQGAFLIEPEFHSDNRGFFARSYCQKEFASHNLADSFVQCNISFNLKKGTLRGMHFQSPPSQEAKLVRCTKGAIYDVLVDIRKNSPTYKKWVAVELTSENRKMLYVPQGFAHGFQTLSDNSEVFYQMSEFYNPQCSSGFCYNDSKVLIKWPLAVSAISLKDMELAELQ